jgi:teichuronic acid exporter
MSLKQRAVSGILWSAADNFVNYGFTFIVGIILARLLSPSEFGLIGMTTIFIAVSESIMRSGFPDALIRKKVCSQVDYSTVFYFNFLVGLFFLILLFIISPSISRFFNEPTLKNIIRVLSLTIIIDSLSVIQNTVLVKRVDFKLQTRISFLSAFGSGFMALVLAAKGFGVWSLVVLTVSKQTLNTVLLWLWNNWRPSLEFSWQSFKELFGFGSKLLISGLIDTIYLNVYNLVIGKYYSSSDLGFYTRAQTFSNFPAHNVNRIMGRVTYPILALMQDNKDELKNAYKKMIKSVMLVTFILMLGLVAVAEPLVITLIGEKWRPSIIYLQMLSFGAMLYPLQAINLNMLKISGRSDLFLRLEIIKKALAVPVIICGILWGIKIMIAGMIMISFISYFLNSYWSGKFVNYSISEQVGDIIPSFFIALGMAALVYFTGLILPVPYTTKLFIQLITGAVFVVGVCEVLQIPEYLYIKNIIKSKVVKLKTYGAR